MTADAAAAFVRPDAQRARLLRDAPAGFDAAEWRQMAAMGWLGVLAPQEDGGLALGVDTACAIAHRLGYASWPEPFVAVAVFAVKLLAASPRSELRRHLLQGIVDGSNSPAVGWMGEVGACGQCWRCSGHRWR